MFNLFTTVDTTRSSVSINPGFLLAKRIYKEKLDTLVNYYHNSSFAVDNQHFLVVILKSLSLNPYTNIYDFIDVVANKAPYIAKTFNLTSPLNKGQLFDGIFYGTNSKELLLYVEEEFDISNTEKEWESMEPVKVVFHNNSDLNMLLPNVDYKYPTDTLSVFSINLILLAVQYREWFLLQKDNEVIRTEQQFIHGYVLPNMLASQLKMTTYNIFTNLYFDTPMSIIKGKHPISTRDYTDKVIKLYSTVIKSLDKKKIRYQDALKNIPSLVDDNAYLDLLLPDSVINRQNRWAFMVSRLDVVTSIMIIAGERSYNINKKIINDLKISLKMLERDNSLSNILTKEMLDRQDYNIELIMNI